MPLTDTDINPGQHNKLQCIPDSLTVSDQNLVSTNFGVVPRN